MTSGTKRPAGARTRAAILREAASLATVEGLEGLSIGNLAAALGMSKSGLYAHFGSKLDLQLATVDEANRIFRAQVIDPAMAAPPGVPQLIAICDAFVAYVACGTFPGGCFFAGAVLEVGARPGPLAERVAEFQRSFVALIRQVVDRAIELGQLADDEDPAQLTFELNGLMLAANTGFVVQRDPRTLDLARQTVRRRLGVAALR